MKRNIAALALSVVALVGSIATSIKYGTPAPTAAPTPDATAQRAYVDDTLKRVNIIDPQLRVLVLLTLQPTFSENLTRSQRNLLTIDTYALIKFTDDYMLLVSPPVGMQSLHDKVLLTTGTCKDFGRWIYRISTGEAEFDEPMFRTLSTTCVDALNTMYDAFELFTKPQPSA